MAIKVYTIRNHGLYDIEISGGEFQKLREILEKWHFKDYESVLTFMISLVVLNEAPSFGILLDERHQDIAPAHDLLQPKNKG